MAEKTIRAFIGIELAEKLKRDLSASLASLKNQMPGFRFVGPHNWHLTLHFFGSVLPADLERLALHLTRMIGERRSFEFQLDQFGFWPGFEQARIFWVGFKKDPPALIQLKNCIDEALKISGCPVESRPYHPHVTLARARSKAGTIARRNLAVSGDCFAVMFSRRLPSQPVHCVTLFQSVLAPKGPDHRPLFSFSLATH